MAQEADRLGFHSVWTSEAWGADAVTVASWIAATTEQIGIGTAIMQMPARTPATTAMTVATLDQLSGGRVLLGLGTSGPQVVEGWHGVPWGKPLGRTREYVEIVRAALRRETVEHHGPHYDIPYSGEDATGLGKPLKLILKPLRREVPIYLAALGPKNVALAVEIADGWLPIFFSPYRFREIHGPSLENASEDFQIAPLCPVLVGRRRPGLPRHDEADARALHRRHGRAREELLQLARRSATASRRRPRRSRSSTSPG